jgi:hypothetical protein
MRSHGAPASTRSRELHHTGAVPRVGSAAKRHHAATAYAPDGETGKVFSSLAYFAYHNANGRREPGAGLATAGHCPTVRWIRRSNGLNRAAAFTWQTDNQLDILDACACFWRHVLCCVKQFSLQLYARFVERRSEFAAGSESESAECSHAGSALPPGSRRIARAETAVSSQNRPVFQGSRRIYDVSLYETGRFH